MTKSEIPTIQTKSEVISMCANSKDEKLCELLECFCQLSEEEQNVILEKAAAMCQENEKMQHSYDVNE